MKADIAAVLLRDLWMTGKLGKAQSSESFYKVTAALRAFNERRVVKQIQVDDALDQFDELERSLRASLDTASVLCAPRQKLPAHSASF